VNRSIPRPEGQVLLQVRDVATETFYEEARVPVESGAGRVYTQTFTTSGKSGGAKRALRVTLHFRSPKSAALVDDVRMVRVLTSEEEAQEG